MNSSLNQWIAEGAATVSPALWNGAQIISLALLLLGLDRFLRHRWSATARHALWLLLLIRLCLPIGWTLPVVPLPSLGSTAFHPPGTFDTAKPGWRIQHQITSTQSDLNRASPARAWPWIPGCLFLTWTAGAALAALRLVRHWRGGRKATRGLPPAARIWTEGAAEQAEALGLTRVPCVRTSTFARVPSLVGWFRPILVIPAGLEAHLTSGEVRSILLHELIHLRRRDPWFAGVLAVVQVLHWWNPAVWLASRRLHDLAEEAVDEQVSHVLQGDPTEYAGALVRVGRLLQGQDQRFHAGFMAMAESSSRLRHRVNLLLTASATPVAGLHGRERGWVWALGLILVPLGFHVPAANPPVPAGPPSPPAVRTQAADPVRSMDEPSVLITCKLLEMPEKTFLEYAAKHNWPRDVPQGSIVTAADNPAEALLLGLVQKEGVDILSAPRVTTRPGTTAMVEMVSGKERSGVMVEVRPELKDKSSDISLDVKVTVRDRPAGSQGPLRERSLNSAATFPRGCSLVMFHNEPGTTGPGHRVLFVLLTPEVLTKERMENPQPSRDSQPLEPQP